MVKDVQISLDKVVDDYYAGLAEKTTLGFTFEGSAKNNILGEDGFLENISKSIDESNKKFKTLDSIKPSKIKGLKIFRGKKADSLLLENNEAHGWLPKKDSNNNLKFIDKPDSTYFNDIKLLTTKVVFSINNDSLNVNQIDSLLKIDLSRKNLMIDYFLDYKKPKQKFPESLRSKTKNNDTIEDKKYNLLSATSKSTFLPKNSSLQIYFKNISTAVFKRIFFGIFISSLLVLAVIGCLFYLLKIIQKQKQLGELKNDLISNITHEFKTPIATIGVAMESISDFNVIDDKEKTKKYIEMSSNQLSKLNIMVEKLLETATLDSEALELNKEAINIVEFLESMVNRYKMQHREKTFTSNIDLENVSLHIDVFHFENAINNVLDNAVKYGGDQISLEFFLKGNTVEILISDNGNSLNKTNKNRIFQKFYRIPKGNTHDVKGFGIGLYYTKSIIEKHGGNIALDLKTKLTTFKISLPND
ncbi:hypothetical protein GCM10023330_01250 [Litoribaculum gwangyangense]|uniref:histidine kinase n=1 Tax=Litoribaculum gwangyangense TaxID=1130722 RepID=A0ABP9BUW2_9FLAO